MWYVKNLPNWERIVRFVAAAFMAACAWRYFNTPVGWIFAAAGVITVLTSLVGFCPMCALAGRKAIAADNKRSSS
jgi:Protein of unknown function (DUF2892)